MLRVVYNVVMKKNIPKILAVVLLSTIAILMIVAGTGSIKDLIEGTNTNNQLDNVPTVDASGGNNVEVEPPSNNDSNDVEVLPPIVEHFPIAPEKSEINRFVQRVSLIDSKLNGVVYIQNASFIVVTHVTENGAFKVPKKTQTIIKMDENGTVLSAYSLNAKNETDFLCVKLVASGIALAVTDGNRTYLYTVSLDFSEINLLELPYFAKANIFSLDSGMLFFGIGAENAVYKIINNVVVSSNALGIGDVKAIYDFSSYYALFLSGINGYSFIKLNNNLTLISTITLPSRTLLAVEPIVEDKEQRFIAVEQTENGVEIAKYDLSFSLNNAERVGVGLGESAEVFINGQSIFLLLHASAERLYLVDNNLAFTASNNTTFQGITNLYDCSVTVEGYRVLYAKGKQLYLVDVRNDGTTQTVNLDIATNSSFLIETNNAYAVVYETEEGIVIVGIN